MPKDKIIEVTKENKKAPEGYLTLHIQSYGINGLFHVLPKQNCKYCNGSGMQGPEDIKNTCSCVLRRANDYAQRASIDKAHHGKGIVAKNYKSPRQEQRERLEHQIAQLTEGIKKAANGTVQMDLEIQLVKLKNRLKSLQ